MNLELEKSSTFLSKLRQMNDISGAIIIRRNGNIIDHNFKESKLAEKYAELILDTSRLIYQLDREGRTSRSKSFLLKGTFGIIFILVWQSAKICTGIVGKDTMNIGMLHALYDEFLGKVEKYSE